MKNSRYLFPTIIALAIVWFVITWMYISLDIYDVSTIPEGGYKILHFREKFIELSLILGMFAFGFCLGSYFFGEKVTTEKENLRGFQSIVDNSDNLQIIEGIGPKIEELLKKSGVISFKKLKDTSSAELKNFLEKGGKQFSLANPASWGRQALYITDREWEKLEKYQESLRSKK